MLRHVQDFLGRLSLSESDGTAMEPEQSASSDHAETSPSELKKEVHFTTEPPKLIDIVKEVFEEEDEAKGSLEEVIDWETSEASATSAESKDIITHSACSACSDSDSATASKKTIEIHKDTHQPTYAWDKLKVHQTVRKVKPLSRKTPISPNKVRFVCISDTHNKTSGMPEPIPDGDVLLHAGDFTTVGDVRQVLEFNDFLGTLPHKHKLVIAGNHDLTFDPTYLNSHQKELKWRFGVKTCDMVDVLNERGLDNPSQLLTNCTYLEDSSTQVYGLTVYGSPWQPEFCNWGFNLPRGQPCLEKWDMIPSEGVDVLMTHGPPIGHGDYCYDGQRAGCVELLHTIQQRVKPKFHIFGHIHEGYGITTDGVTRYVNASTCTLRYKATNPAIIFDIPLPPGYRRFAPLRRTRH